MSDQIEIIDLLTKSYHPVLSFEFFPPKDDKGMERLANTAEQLKAAQPDFVTVTWGAGGSTRARTLDVCDMLKAIGFNPVMPHLTCVGVSRGELGEITDEIYQRGYRNIMALRGDPPQGEENFKPHPDGLRYASELVDLVKRRHPDVCCGVAGYPEAHPESDSPDADVLNLNKKLAAGGAFITTQLFYDNALFFDFKERCRRANIHVPILPGLLPAVSLKQALKISKLCRAKFPLSFYQALEEAGGEGEEAARVGVEWAVQQVKELITRRVPGIHLYVLNRSSAVLRPAFINCLKQSRAPYNA